MTSVAIERTSDERTKWIAWYVTLAIMIACAGYLTRNLEWWVVWRYREFLMKGLWNSVAFAALSIAIGMVVGTVLACARSYGDTIIRTIAISLIEVVRATPQLMIILWVYFIFPEVTKQTISPELCGLISLSIIASAYLAEVIRSGLMSVAPIQTESGYATGLSRLSILMWIVLPQALRNMLPALLATWVMLFKTTTLVYVIGIVEFFHAATIVNSRELIPFTVYTVLAVVYFVCCYLMSYTVKRLDPKYVLHS